MRNRSNRRRGVVNVWVVLTLFLIVGLVGLALDFAWCSLVLNQLQAAADSSALAGAYQVKLDQELARRQSFDLALANKAANTAVRLNENTDNLESGDIVIGRYSRNTHTFTATTSNPNAVKVTANRTASGIDGQVPLIFGQAFGVSSVPLSRTAIAMTAGGTGAGMLVLHPTANCALDISGNANLQVNDGVIQVNSNNPCAVCNNGNPIISASDLNIVGSSCLDSGIMTGDIYNNQPVVPDPLAGLPAPNPFGLTRASPGQSNDVTISPGHYPNGIVRTGGNLIMEPGIYVIEGTGGSGNNAGGFNIQLGAGASLIGNGVLIYLNTGSVRINGGGGNITLNPPGSGEPPITFPGWEPYEHITIFQGRTNTNEAFINGSAGMNLTGTMYFPNNRVNLLGSGLGYGNQLIASMVSIGGNGNVQIAYDGAFPAAAAGKVFLVE